MELPKSVLSNSEERELEDASDTMDRLYDKYDYHRGKYRDARIAVLEWQLKKPIPDNYLSELNRLTDIEAQAFNDWNSEGNKEVDLENKYTLIYNRYQDSSGNNFVPVKLNPGGFYKLPQWNK